MPAEIHQIPRIYSPLSLVSENQGEMKKQHGLVSHQHHSGDLECNGLVHVFALHMVLDDQPTTKGPSPPNEQPENPDDDRLSKSSATSNEQQKNDSKTPSTDIGIKRTSGSLSFTNPLPEMVTERISINIGGLRSERIAVQKKPSDQSATTDSPSFFQYEELINRGDSCPSQMHDMDSVPSVTFLANVAQTFPDESLLSLCERIWLAIH